MERRLLNRTNPDLPLLLPWIRSKVGYCGTIAATPALPSAVATSLANMRCPGLLTANLPPGLLTHLTTHSATYWSFYQRFLAISSAIQTYWIKPARTTLLGVLFGDSLDSRDMTSMVLLLIIGLITIQALNMLRRAVMFWVRLSFRIAWWVMLAGLGLWIWQKGPKGVGQDLQRWCQVWASEYDEWQRRQAVASYSQYRYGGRGGYGLWG